MIQEELSILLFLIVLIAVIFYLSSLPFKISKIVFQAIPPLLFCYFLPSFMVEIGIIDSSKSDLNTSLSKVLLPFCIFYFTLGLPLKKLKSIGKNFLIVFLAGSLGVIIGGPIALFVSHSFFPESFNSESYRGMSTIAGSWIGGTTNQMALNSIFTPNADEFAKAVTVDVFFGEIWLTMLLLLIPFQSKINNYIGSKVNLESEFNSIEESSHSKDLNFIHVFYILGLGLFMSQLSIYLGATLQEYLSSLLGKSPALEFLNKSFWTFLISTILGLSLGLTRVHRTYEMGGDVFSSIFLYIIIASIGLKISLGHLFSTPILLFTGFIWISIHGLAIFVVGKLTKSPYHYMAIASQANVGGIASASVISTAISPKLTPFGVILALLGYAIGTYGGYLSALLMKLISINY
ncbi:MAG: DUF819 domain-containing protein [Aquirufa sp.]